MVLEAIQAKIKDADIKVKAWVAKQPLPVEVLVSGVGNGVQGGIIGGLMGSLSSDLPAPNAAQLTPEAAASMQKMKALAGGPWIQGRNFAVMAGVNSAIHTAMRRIRGVDDFQNSIVAGFGSGAAFSLVSGVQTTSGNPAMNAVATGLSFAMVQGLFAGIGEKFGKPPGEDVDYLRTKGMLRQLGLQKYEKNFRKGFLTDATLPLLNDSALRDVNIPPGPRLLIMDHVSQSYQDSRAIGFLAGGKGL